MLKSDLHCVAVVGLGYVGLPLAVAFGRYVSTIGFDLDERKVASYQEGVDPTGEVKKQAFSDASKIAFTTNPSELAVADVVIVAVPTPINPNKTPDLSALENASRMVAANLKRGAIVVYESTVYPGVTEDVCGPIIEKVSGYARGRDFKLGYSPERINPGDNVHTLENVVKVVAGEDDASAELLVELYGMVVKAGIYKAPSIKVAEAAKVIENTQRDLNIALMNELAVIFHKMGIDTREVLSAADTKWNFLPFRPGLVGGHCIGVDPYYLTYKAGELGYHPEVILAGRRINDGMGRYVASATIKQMVARGIDLSSATVTVLGVTFKENCPDVRNSRVIDLIGELSEFGVNVQVCDPLADASDVQNEYGLQLIDQVDLQRADALVLAVAHQEYVELQALDFKAMLKSDASVFIDVKSCFDKSALEDAGLNVWRL